MLEARLLSSEKEKKGKRKKEKSTFSDSGNRLEQTQFIYLFIL